MSVKAKKFLRKLISLSGVLFFCMAAGMLYWQLKDYSARDILSAILSLPIENLILAGVACIIGYLALGFYDYLALRYVDKKVVWWKWLMAGVLGFAVSNNAGHAVISGGAVRYRLYMRWRVRAGEILKMLIFSGFTYFLGASAIVVIGYFLVPHSYFEGSIGATVGIKALFYFCVAALTVYFLGTIFFKNKKIQIKNAKLKIPSTKTAIIQTTLGIIDSLMAGMVLYFCLIPFVDIPFRIFIGLFVIAQTAGVFSQVPGGIGVFESVFLLALPNDVDKATIFGGLLAYRIIYYLLPLIGIGGVFFIYERCLRARMKAWLAVAKSKIPQMPQMPKRSPGKKESPKKTKAPNKKKKK